MSNFDFICERYEFSHKFFSTYNTSNSDASSHKVQNVMTWCNDVSNLKVSKKNFCKNSLFNH
jgi:hypothetical protein